MISEMTKQAGMALGERVKVAAAILTMHHYDRTQGQILDLAGEIKTAALQKYGQAISDDQAVEAAIRAMEEEESQRSLAGLLGRYKDYSKDYAQRVSEHPLFYGTGGIARDLKRSAGPVWDANVGAANWIKDTNVDAAQRLLAILRRNQGGQEA